LTVLLAAAVLCIGAAASSDACDSASVGRFGVTEVTTMLTLGATVLGLFVLAQLVALTDAGRRLVESSGLTPAEYARNGFFQLCWATALIVIFVTLVRALAAPEVLHRRLVRVLGGAVPLLATGLVVVSLRRMALYDRAFGLTMLRLWVIGAAVWMGAVLVMIAARNIGIGKARDWIVAGAGVAAFVLVIAADLANPEAFVVSHNVARLRAGAELDVHYLVGLSDDAVPAIAQASRSVEDPALREAIGAAVRCQDRRGGAANLNLGVARAAEARRAGCPS
jgi:hypothetical protein